MLVIIIIVLIILLGLSAYATFKSAEAHELHKIRAAFEDRRDYINKLLEDYENHLEYPDDYYQGKLREIDEMEALIDEELEILKTFDFDSSD